MPHSAHDEALIEALGRVFAMAALDRLLAEAEATGADNFETTVDESPDQPDIPRAAGR